MKILIILFASAILLSCVFTTESPGEIPNGIYTSHFDSISSSQHYIYDWEIQFSFQHYHLTEIESRFDVLADGKKKIWMRTIRREAGKYSLDSGRILYRDVRFGFKNLSTMWDGENSVLSLRPSNVDIDSPYDFKNTDSIQIGPNEIWKSQVEQFNTRKVLFHFRKDD